jgi:hypothetical protein
MLVRLFLNAHEAADAFAHPAFRAPSLGAGIFWREWGKPQARMRR